MDIQSTGTQRFNEMLKNFIPIVQQMLYQNRQQQGLMDYESYRQQGMMDYAGETNKNQVNQIMLRMANDVAKMPRLQNLLTRIQQAELLDQDTTALWGQYHEGVEAAVVPIIEASVGNTLQPQQLSQVALYLPEQLTEVTKQQLGTPERKIKEGRLAEDVASRKETNAIRGYEAETGRFSAETARGNLNLEREKWLVEQGQGSRLPEKDITAYNSMIEKAMAYINTHVLKAPSEETSQIMGLLGQRMEEIAGKYEVAGYLKPKGKEPNVELTKKNAQTIMSELSDIQIQLRQFKSITSGQLEFMRDVYKMSEMQEKFTEAEAGGGPPPTANLPSAEDRPQNAAEWDYIFKETYLKAFGEAEGRARMIRMFGDRPAR